MSFKLQHYKQIGEPQKVGLYYHISVSVEESYRDKMYKAMSCPSCESSRILKHGKYKHIVLDIPFQDTPSKLIIARVRYRCNVCGATFVETLPEVNEYFKMTNRAFELVKRYIEQKQKPYAEVSKEIGISVQAIRNIAHFLTEATINTSIHFQTPSILGIHEFKLLSTYVTIFTNIESQKIINIIPRKNIDLFQDYLNNLNDKRKVKYVFIDIAPLSMNSIKNIIIEAGLAKAELIIDKNKIATMLSNKFLSAILKILSSELTVQDKINFRYMSTKMLSYAEQGKFNEAEDLIRDIITKHKKQFPNIQKLYKEYQMLIKFIHKPSQNDIEKIRMNFIGNDDTYISSTFRQLSQQVINFEHEILNSEKQGISVEYRDNIAQLFENLKKLKSTYAIGELWEHLVSTKYYPPNYPDEKLLQRYKVLYSKKAIERNEGISIKILNEILGNLPDFKVKKSQIS